MEMASASTEIGENLLKLLKMEEIPIKIVKIDSELFEDLRKIKNGNFLVFFKSI